MLRRRCRASESSTVVMRSMAAVIAFRTATRARSWLEPLVRARPPRPVVRAEFVQQRLALAACGLDPAGVGPGLCLGELVVEVTQALPVRRKGLPVGYITESGCCDHPGAGADEVEGSHGLPGSADQLAQVTETAQARDRCARPADEP